MKKLLLLLSLLLSPTLTWAQCNGVFPNNTACGNITGDTATPRAIPLNSFPANSPGGTTGQIQYNAGGGLFGGFTASGDATIDTATGIVTVTKYPLAVSAAKTASYPIVSSDCNSTVPFGTGATAQITATLPGLPSSGFNAGCIVYVKNSNANSATSHATTLSGFPSDLNTLLWAGQAVGVQVNATATGWITISNPGRWRVPGQVTLHFDKTNGNNANDCLSATTGACQDAQTAWNIQQYQFDNNGTTPILAAACGQTHTTALSMGGTPLGTNLVQLSPDGNCTATWTNAGPCIALADLSELALNLTYYGSSGSITFGCNITNAAFSGNIYLHNDVVLDLNGTPIWTPAGSNDNFLFCDGKCQFTVADGITQALATGANYIINMSAGGHGTQSGVISASGSGTINGTFYIFGGAVLNRGTSDGSGWFSVGTSKVYANSTLINNGTTAAGGVTIGASAANCTSLTSSC